MNKIMVPGARCDGGIYRCRAQLGFRRGRLLQPWHGKVRLGRRYYWAEAHSRMPAEHNLPASALLTRKGARD